MRGYRLGQIEISREILIRCLRIKGKEQNTVLSKELVKKINREIDIDFLHNFILTLSNNQITVKEFDVYYDMYFLMPEKNAKSKYLWRWSGEKT